MIDTYKPDEVAFEELFFSKNITTGMAVSMARGVALATVVERTDNLYEYTPMQIKQAVTGYGGADKHQVQLMVKMLTGHGQDIARPDDAADAAGRGDMPRAFAQQRARRPKSPKIKMPDTA